MNNPTVFLNKYICTQKDVEILYACNCKTKIEMYFDIVWKILKENILGSQIKYSIKLYDLLVNRVE